MRRTTVAQRRGRLPLLKTKRKNELLAHFESEDGGCTAAIIAREAWCGRRWLFSRGMRGA
jgi:hypothetical protein